MTIKAAVTGASGFLGFHLVKKLSSLYHTTGFYHRNPVEFHAAETATLQVNKYREVENMMKKLRPDIIFHLASISNPNQCEKNPGESYEINVTGTKNIVAVAKKIGAEVIFTSTDLVFNGTKAPYSEEDTPEPVNRYGQQKLEAEKTVLDYDKGKVVRLPLMFGPKSPHSGSFLQPMINFLRANSKVTLFEDEFRTPISLNKAADALLFIASNDSKLLHVSCDQRISRYDLGIKIADYLGLDKNLIIKAKQKDFHFPATRPSDTSLNIEKAKSLGFNPCALHDELTWVLDYI